MPTVSNKVREKGNMQTQRVDYVASLLMSVLIVVGGLVLLLFVYWLTSTFQWKAGGITVEAETLPGRGDHAAGFERDIEPPGAEEIEELAEPTIQDSLEAVVDTATNVAASIQAVDSSAEDTVVGSGRGDSRPPGPLGEGDDIIPRYERWELKFQAKGIKEYAEQLDFYKIELACIGGGVPTIDYAISLAQSPEKRSDTSEVESKRQRLYFVWRTANQLRQYDTQLLGQAAVKTQGRLILKFISKELEEQLAILEKESYLKAGRQSAKQIAKTVFESQPTAGGYAFVVINQQYR